MKYILTSKGKTYEHDSRSLLKALSAILACMLSGESITITAK